MLRAPRALLCLLALALGLVAAAPAAARTDATTTVTVTLTEMKFTLSKKTVKRGTVVFKLVNKGFVEHDMRIAGKRSPKVQPGKTVTWRVGFKKAGKYAFLCTLPGHAPAGMKGVLTVK